jgi:hypothetical protein
VAALQKDQSVDRRGFGGRYQRLCEDPNYVKIRWRRQGCHGLKPPVASHSLMACGSHTSTPGDRSTVLIRSCVLNRGSVFPHNLLQRRSLGSGDDRTVRFILDRLEAQGIFYDRDNM